MNPDRIPDKQIQLEQKIIARESCAIFLGGLSVSSFWLAVMGESRFVSLVGYTFGAGAAILERSARKARNVYQRYLLEERESTNKLEEWYTIDSSEVTGYND